MVELFSKLFFACLQTLIIVALSAYIMERLENNLAGKIVFALVLFCMLVGIAAGDIAIWLF